MSFFAFKLIFAAIAIGLLVIVLLIVRKVLSKREPHAPKPPREKAVKAVKTSVSAPELEPEARSVPPVRRRQLQSFVESEKLANPQDDEPLAFVAPPVVPEQEEAPVADVPPETEPALPQPDTAPTDFDQVVLARLEEAFEALQAGEITFDGYREQLLAEQGMVEHRIALLQPAGDGAELEAALAARESVEWCLDWAADQAGER